MKKLIFAFLFGTITSIGFTQNLITNGTFEDDSMELNCEGWFFSYDEPLSIQVDSCVNGFFEKSTEKIWSLHLGGGWPGTVKAETYVTGLEGNNIYQLIYDMKTPLTGTAYVGKLVEGELTFRKQLTDTASNWRRLNLLDTISTEVNDTIVIGFSGADCDFCPNTASFDNISFSTDIIPVSTNDIEEIDLRKISIYPNPTTEYLIFRLDPLLELNGQLYVYDSFGRLIETAPINKSMHKLNTRFLSSGLYYYRLENKRNKKLSGLGKFIVE